MVFVDTPIVNSIFKHDPYLIKIILQSQRFDSLNFLLDQGPGESYPTEPMILWMEEILHQLVDGLSQYL